MRANLEYRRIDSIEGLGSLGPQWRDLDALQAQPLLPLTHLWHVAWWDSFGTNFDLALGAVLLDGELIAIAPLYSTEVRERGLRLETTELASNGYSPFSDLLLAPRLSESMVDQVLDLLVVHNPCDVMRLRKLPANGVVAERASREDGLPRTIGVDHILQTPIISLQGDWDSYLAALSSASRKTVRRKLKRLQRNDELSIKQFVVQDSTAPVLKDIVCVSSRSWKSATQSDLGGDEAGRKFLWRLIDELGPNDSVTVWMLYSGSKPISFELLFHYGGVVYPIRADYDQAFAHLSPGSILMAHVLKHLFDNGADHTYDCCGDNYDYLRSWTKKTRNYVDVELFARGLRPSLAYSLKYQVAPVWRRLSRSTLRLTRWALPQAKRAHT